MEKITKISIQVAQKLGMKKGDWFRNLCLWEIYKARPSAFDRCKDYDEVKSKGLIPEELIVDDLIDFEAF